MVPGEISHKEISAKMKERSFLLNTLKKKAILSAIIVLLAGSACVNRKDKTEHDNLIPEKTFTAILADIYLANGVLTLPEIRRDYSQRDSVRNYMDIIANYGYSYEEMNNTVNYYFVSKPKKLIRLYDQVIGDLSKKEALMQDEITSQGFQNSMAGKEENIYLFPDITRTENPGTIINIPSPGTFTITFSITLFPDDPSCNPHFSAWLVDADSLETGRRKWLPDIRYIKDGHPHQYVYTGTVEEKRPMAVRTILFEYENNIAENERHAIIEILSSNFTALL
jgi:hypothetical protein